MVKKKTIYLGGNKLNVKVVENNTDLNAKIDGKNVVNLNTHIITVKQGTDLILYPVGSRKKPKILYSLIPDPKAPESNKLVTIDVDDLPLPEKGILFIVNRETISATRKIEKKLRASSKYNTMMKFIIGNADWLDTIDNTNFNIKEIQRLKKFVGRHDLRAPGEQVRGKDNKVMYCHGLISEFE